MKSLVILRHAKSDWDTDAATDFERPLNTKGLKDAPKIGAQLATLVVDINKILCSPAIRTTQTWQLVNEQLKNHEHDEIFIEEIYEADLDTLLAVISAHAADADVLMLVGHNPGCQMLATHLCGNMEEIKPGTALIMVNDADSWQQALISRWQLSHFLRP